MDHLPHIPPIADDYFQDPSSREASPLAPDTTPTSASPQKKSPSFIKRLLKFIILNVFFLLALLFLLWRALEVYPQHAAYLLGKVLHLHIEVAKIDTGWGAWQPRIHLQKLRIRSENKKTLWLSVDDIRILFHLPIQNTNKNHYIKNIELNNAFIYGEYSQKNKQSSWTWMNKTFTGGQSFDNLPDFLFNYEQVLCKNADIRIQTPNKTLDIHMNTELLHSPIKTQKILPYMVQTKIILKDNFIESAELKADMYFSPRSNLAAFIGYFKDWEGSANIQLKHNENFLQNIQYMPIQIQQKWLDEIKNIQTNGLIDIKLDWQSETIKHADINATWNDTRGHLMQADQPLAKKIHTEIMFNAQSDKKNTSKPLLSIKKAIFDAYKIENIDIYQSFKNPVLRMQKNNLIDMQNIIRQFSLPNELKSFIERAKPEGSIEFLHYDHATQKVIGKLHQIKIDAYSENNHIIWPGIQNAQLNIALDLKKNLHQLNIQAQKSFLHLPFVFKDEQMAFNELQMQINIDQNKKEYHIKNAKVITADGFLDAQGMLHSGNQLDISGNAYVKKIPLLWRYLPQALGDKTLGLLNEHIKDGKVKKANWQLKGDIHHLFDNTNPQNIFAIHVDFEEGVFKIPDVHNNAWPYLENIQGKFHLINHQLWLDEIQAKSFGLSVKTQILKITDLLTSDLQIQGSIEGDIEKMRQYIYKSPVSQWLGDFAKDASAQKNATIQLTLNIPLHHNGKPLVKGEIQFSNNQLKLFNSNMPDLPSIDNIQGKIIFDEKGFQFNNIQAQILNQNIQASTRHKTLEDGIHLHVQGRMDEKILENQQYKNIFTALQPYIKGSFDYNADIKIKKNDIDISMNSDLQGLAIYLPEPLKKESNGKRPIALQWNKKIANNQWHIEYGDYFHALLNQDNSNKNIRGMYILHANKVTPDMMQLPEDGIQANIYMNDINADEWKIFYKRIQQSNQGSYEDREDNGILKNYIPERLALYSKHMYIFDREFNNIVLALSQKDRGWQGNINSKNLNGYFTWDPKSKNYSNGMLKAYFSKVLIPQKISKQEIANIVQEKTQNLPAIQMKVDEFIFDEKNLGKLQLSAFNHSENKVWKLQEFNLSNSAFTLQAEGDWQMDENKNKTTIKTTMDIKDSGEALKILGAPKIFKQGKGDIKADLSWHGSPIDFNTITLKGDLAFGIRDGIILQVDPAIAKLLGIFSLQSLGKILTFNWNKLFAQGSPFDDIQAKTQIKAGLMRVEEFKMNSPQAKAKIQGEINLNQETQNLSADIYPQFNAGTASLAYAVINPAIGLGSLVAQFVLANPLSKILKQTYSIQGNWQKPIIKHKSWSEEEKEKNAYVNEDR